MPTPSDLYFAYGSNMSTRRLRARIASAVAYGRARIDGHRLAFDKPGRDGSGKANLVVHAGADAWGVLWAISSRDWPRLDRFESGYERCSVEVAAPDGRLVSAHTYLWRGAACSEPPFDWYRDHLLDGAREHGLPRDVVARIAVLATRRASAPPE